MIFQNDDFAACAAKFANIFGIIYLSGRNVFIFENRYKVVNHSTLPVSLPATWCHAGPLWREIELFVTSSGVGPNCAFCAVRRALCFGGTACLHCSAWKTPSLAILSRKQQFWEEDPQQLNCALANRTNQKTVQRKCLTPLWSRDFISYIW